MFTITGITRNRQKVNMSAQSLDLAYELISDMKIASIWKSIGNNQKILLFRKIAKS